MRALPSRRGEFGRRRKMRTRRNKIQVQRAEEEHWVSLVRVLGRDSTCGFGGVRVGLERAWKTELAMMTERR